MGRSKAGGARRVPMIGGFLFSALSMAALCGCAAQHAHADSGTAKGSIFDVRSFGAVGDGKTLSTSAIQKALDQCGAAGGGTVIFTAGTYLSKPLTLRTKTTLLLQKGAVLKATD